jgi:hypothetical protein
VQRFLVGCSKALYQPEFFKILGFDTMQGESFFMAIPILIERLLYFIPAV